MPSIVIGDFALAGTIRITVSDSCECVHCPMTREANGNVPVFYCVPADVYEAMMSRLEDLEFNVIAEARAGQQVTKVTFNEL